MDRIERALRAAFPDLDAAGINHEARILRAAEWAGVPDADKQEMLEVDGGWTPRQARALMRAWAEAQ